MCRILWILNQALKIWLLIGCFWDFFRFGVMKMILRNFILFGMIFGIIFGIIHRDNQLKWFCRVRAGGSSESMTKTGLFTQSWIDWNQKQKKMGIEYSIPRMSEATGSTWGPIRYWIQKISKLFVDESIVIRIKQNQNYSFETIDFFCRFQSSPSIWLRINSIDVNVTFRSSWRMTFFADNVIS